MVNITESFSDQITEHSSTYFMGLKEEEFILMFFSLLIGSILLLVVWIKIFKTSFNKKSLLKLEEMVTIIVDKKEGIRELNPNFKVIVPNENNLKSNVLTPMSENLLEILKQTPNRELLGYHDKPDAPYKWITVKEFLEKISDLASGLHHELNINPGAEAKVGIYGTNCIEWVVTHMALYMYSNVAVPLYSTLGNEAMVHIGGHTKMTSCVVMNEAKGHNLLEIFAKAKIENGSTAIDYLKSIVVMRSTSPEALKEFRNKYPNIKMVTMCDLMEVGRNRPVQMKLPNDDAIYVINFTSGTTGIPKGVIITGGMIKNLIHSVYNTRPLTTFINEGDVYFSFLPLAHVLEQLLTISFLYTKGKIGYFSGNISDLLTEIQTLQPTILTLVPRLLVRLHDQAMKKFQQYHIPMWLVNYAVNSKIAHIAKYGANKKSIWDRILFKKLQEGLGGRVKVMITGGSSCPPNVLNFSRAALGSILYSAYGSTECGGPATSTFTQDTDPSHAGAPIHGVQVKLGDVADMNLFPSKNNGNGRGEVLIKSKMCTQGYYNDPEKTRELIDENGWLHSGDIGEWDESGHLKIVDRCKNIFKLSQGEYIAPDKVENIYSLCSLVEQVFIDGRSDQSFAIALVYPNVRALENLFGFKMVKEGDEVTNKNSLTMKQICSKVEFQDHILKKMNETGRENNLSGFELARQLRLIEEPMSVENAMLTTTLKPVRGVIRKVYEKEINEMYSL